MMQRGSIAPAALLAITAAFAMETGAQQPAAETVLSDVEVVGERERQKSAADPVQGYKAERSVTPMKTDTPILNIPQSISVVTEDIIEDRQVTEVPRALETVPGLTKQGTVLGGGFFNINSRGFQIGNESGIRLDGNQFYVLEQPALETIERIEVIRGPSTVYGRLGDPGGLINFVSKLPVQERITDVDLRLGPYGNANVALDLGGKLVESGALNYRFVAANQDAETFRQFSEDDLDVVAGALKWNFSRRGDLTFRFEHRDRERNQDHGLIALPNQNMNPEFFTIPDIPRDRVLNQPWAQYDSDVNTYSYQLNFKLTDNWKFRNYYNYQDFTRFRVDGNPTATRANGDYRITFTERVNTIDLHTITADLIGNVELFGTKHTLLFGADGTNYDFFSKDPLNSAFTCNSNVFAPVICDQPMGRPFIPLRQTIENNYYGVYAQDQVSLTKWLDIVAGVRYDRFQTRSISSNDATSNVKDEPYEKNNAVTPRVSAIVHPRENVSVYATYSESFNPNGTVNEPDFINDGQPLDPETGNQVEAGVKTELLGGRLFASAAVFRLSRQNVAFTDAVNRVVSLIGESESRGVELEVIGEALPGWEISAGYAYLADAEVQRDENSNLVGNRLPKAPKHSGFIWSVYELRGGFFRGLGIGGGVFLRDEIFIDPQNRGRASGYARVDAALSYRFFPKVPLLDAVTLRLNVNNVFDRDYIVSANSLTEIERSAPREAVFSAQLSF